MLPKLPKLHSGVGAVALVMSKYVHPSKSIRDNYSNRPKNHKLQGVVLVEVDVKVVRRGANAILVLTSPISILPDHQFYTSKQYIPVTG